MWICCIIGASLNGSSPIATLNSPHRRLCRRYFGPVGRETTPIHRFNNLLEVDVDIWWRVGKEALLKFFRGLVLVENIDIVISETSVLGVCETA